MQVCIFYGFLQKTNFSSFCAFFESTLKYALSCYVNLICNFVLILYKNSPSTVLCSTVLCKFSSRTIFHEENCQPTPKLTLSQTLTLTGGQIFSGAIVWLLPNLKTDHYLDPNPNPNRGAIFLGEGGQLSGCHVKTFFQRCFVFFFFKKNHL